MTLGEITAGVGIAGLKTFLIWKFKKRWPEWIGWIFRKGVRMEAKEITGGLGTVAQWKVDVDPKGIVKASLAAKEDSAGASAALSVEFDVVVLLEQLAKHTSNSWDDKGVALVKAALGR